jgi:hypothetical protein
MAISKDVLMEWFSGKDQYILLVGGIPEGEQGSPETNGQQHF